MTPAADNISHLNEAFSTFTAASGALETYYEKLRETVRRLTLELEEKNARMKELELHAERNRRLIRMGEMAANIVHEIRSPLCSIELYAGMLESELAGDERAGLAKGISGGIRSLNNILTNMLFFAKPQRPAFSAVDASAVVDEAVGMLAPMIGSRGIRLERRSAGDPRIDGDAELLKQVLLNIVLNAVHATPDGGRISISVGESGGSAVISVADEGEGIREEDREKIFDPFFSTKARGTGLGLTIASKIMQAHDGFIKVRSEAGRGSTFDLRFPARSAEGGVPA